MVGINMQDPLIRIGRNIKKIRLEQHLSQQKLATLIKADKGYISRVEGGKNNLTIRSATKIADALGVTLKKLFV